MILQNVSYGTCHVSGPIGSRCCGGGRLPFDSLGRGCGCEIGGSICGYFGGSE